MSLNYPLKDPGLVFGVPKQPRRGLTMRRDQWLRGEGSVPESLGKRIQTVREERKMTRADLARAVGMSRSLISQIERDTANPSVESLRRIAGALNVPIALLFEERSLTQNMVVRRDERKILRVPRSKLAYELLTPDLNRRIEFLWIELEPGERGPTTPFAHEGEECVLCLKGEVHIWINDQEYTLSEGDSMAYDSGLPHALANLGMEKVVLISAITPPNF